MRRLSPLAAKTRASVRPLVVVVPHVPRETRSKWRRPQISSQSRHSCRTVRTQRSAWAFAFGAWMGVVMIRTPSAAKTSSKARVNFAVAVMEEEPRRGSVPRLLGLHLHRELPRPLDHPGPTWVVGDATELRRGPRD